MSFKSRRGPARGQVKLKVSRKVKLLLALGALGAAMFFAYLSFQVAANCSAETGKACIDIGVKLFG